MGFVLALIFSLFIAAPDQPEDPAALMRQIWSPYCKGVSLMECPSSKAENLRTEINSRIQAGEKFSDIYADLTSRYGPVLRMSPTMAGREGLAYWIPWIVFGVLSFLIITLWMFKKKGPVRGSRPKISAELQRELLQEAKKHLD